MTAYKCDICGVFYEHKVYIEVNDEAACLCSTLRIIDVCPECAGAIQRVIDDRKENKNEL